TLQDSDFRRLGNLKKLNISDCGIITLSANTFEGLDVLEVLDMKNNPVIMHGLPRGVFNALPRLRRLSINGYFTRDEQLSEIGNLDNLEEIALSPHIQHMPYSLAELPKLRTVYFVSGSFGGTLTRSLIKPLAGAHIEQLAFISCGLKEIENGTFDGFSSLNVLNLLNNRDLRLNDVIDALSTSENVSISTLVLDLVGNNRGILFLGPRDFPVCRRAWRHVKRLSLRGTRLMKVGDGFSACLPNVEALSLGFNGFSTMTREDLLRLIIPLRRIKLFDISFFGLRSPGYLNNIDGVHRSANWIKRSEDYFLPPLESPPYHNRSSNGTFSLGKEVIDNCTRLSIPENLEYVLMDYCIYELRSNLDHRCIRFYPNKLRYVSMSNALHRSPLTFNELVYGLENVEVVNVSGNGLSYADWRNFANWQSLRILNLAKNLFGHNAMEPFPPIQKLEQLDFSSNLVRSFPANMFANLRALNVLNVANNKLTMLSFDFPEKLQQLDVSGNLLHTLDGSTRQALDNLPDLMVLLGGNPLGCSCEEADFLDWFQKMSMKISDEQRIKCYNDDTLYKIADLNVAKMKLKCGLTVNNIVITCIVIGFFVLLVVSVYEQQAVRCFNLSASQLKFCIKHIMSKLYDVIRRI
ncbi:hypothetical protein LSH36_1205g00008, partial [Paralvinella palmiformis]